MRPEILLKAIRFCYSSGLKNVTFIFPLVKDHLLWETAQSSIFMQVSLWLYSGIGTDNGLLPIRRQAIIWTNDGLVNWRIYTSLGLDDLTHWGRVTHICVSKLTTIGSYNGLSPGRRQAIIWTNAGILLIRPLGINFIEILFEINTLSFNKMHLTMASAKWRLFRLGRSVLMGVWVDCMEHRKATLCDKVPCLVQLKMYCTWFLK